jgi:hypothetical protein
MKRKQKSKIICKNLIRNFDFLTNQEDKLISVVMDSLNEIKRLESEEMPQMNPPQYMVSR